MYNGFSVNYTFLGENHILLCIYVHYFCPLMFRFLTEMLPPHFAYRPPISLIFRKGFVTYCTCMYDLVLGTVAGNFVEFSCKFFLLFFFVKVVLL